VNISYSDGSTVTNAVIQIWEDLHSERPGMFRAFWCDSPTATTGSPVVGYCSPGGSHPSIKAAALEARRLYPGQAVFRNGKELP
jgi:hypothetical protein